MSTLELPDILVDADWLHAHLAASELVVFDASWHLPTSGRDGHAEWRQRHIPGARFFDFDGRIRDPDSELPHMLPDEALFTREVRALGLNRDSRVVIYDALGIYSSPRAWWMLRAMGCTTCALLDGGLPAWQAAGYPLATADGDRAWPPGNFVARLDPGYVADSRAVLAALDDPAATVLDARPPERFAGKADEPRPGLRRGHMPGAVNLPFTELLRDGRLRPRAELEAILRPLLGGRERAIASCGSGVTASTLAFAAALAGFERVAVYDGSWSEWGRPGGLPVVTD